MLLRKSHWNTHFYELFQTSNSYKKWPVGIEDWRMFYWDRVNVWVVLPNSTRTWKSILRRTLHHHDQCTRKTLTIHQLVALFFKFAMTYLGMLRYSPGSRTVMTEDWTTDQSSSFAEEKKLINIIGIWIFVINTNYLRNYLGRFSSRTFQEVRGTVTSRVDAIAFVCAIVTKIWKYKYSEVLMEQVDN